MMDVSGDEPAEIPRILARSAAALLVHQKFNAVDMREDFRCACADAGLCRLVSENFVSSPLAIKLHEFGHLAAVDLRRGKAQFFLERLLQHGYISVLAENERHDEPIIARPRLPVGAAVSHEGA